MDGRVSVEAVALEAALGLVLAEAAATEEALGGAGLILPWEVGTAPHTDQLMIVPTP